MGPPWPLRLRLRGSVLGCSVRRTCPFDPPTREVHDDRSSARHRRAETRGDQIARYRVTSGERLVIGRRGRGGTELFDAPANGVGPAYHVDRGWLDGAVLEAFLKDYLTQAGCLDRCPMSTAAIGIVIDSTESDEVADLLGAYVEPVMPGSCLDGLKDGSTRRRLSSEGGASLCGSPGPDLSSQLA